MDEISLGVPFTKIDHQKRTVTGIATADNVDLAGDVIKADATAEAFAEWAGNIREMHRPTDAVGKAVSVRNLDLPYKGKIYKAVELEAYISRGAQDTWEKILDGTLRGFSIGGSVIDASEEISKDSKRKVRSINKYKLGEVSVVDNPCNPLSLISLVKMAPNGDLTYGFDMLKYKVYYCPTDEAAYINRTQCENGHSCDQIGQVDEIDLGVITKMISENKELSKRNVIPSYAEDNSVVKLADSFLGGKLQESINNDNVENVSDISTEDVGVIRKFFKALIGDSPESSIEKSDSTWSPTIVINTANPTDVEKAAKTKPKPKADTEDAEDAADGGADEDTEDANGNPKAKGKAKVKKSEEGSDEISTEGEDEMDLEKFMADIGTMFDEKLAKVKEEVAETVTASVDEKIEAISKSLETVEESVEEVKSSGAIKKSADEEADESTDEESEEVGGFWKGAFVHPELVKALGYSE